MNILGFIIGTIVMGILTYGIAVPLSRAFAGANALNLVEAEVAGTEVAGSMDGKRKAPDAVDLVPTGTFIVTHVIVMGIAGLLLGGIFGIYFIGVAWKAKLWPGMIALILASMVTASL